MTQQTKRKRDSSDGEQARRSAFKLRKISNNADIFKSEAASGKQLDNDGTHGSMTMANRDVTFTEDIRYEIFQELEALKKGEKGEYIILPKDVKKLWARRYYRRFYTSQDWYNEAWDKTDSINEFVQIMSILIRIGFDEMKWKRFAVTFIDRHNRKDENLPFPLQELQRDDFLGKMTGILFHTEQFAFCPIRIPQQEDEFPLEAERRLPWIDSPEIIGEGAFGTVTKRTVAKGFLQYQDVTKNERARAVAIKTLSGEDARKGGFRNELGNLKELRECLRDHNRIMVNLVTMVAKSTSVNTYHIVYELAAYDLDVLLTNQPHTLRSKRHATASPERTGSANMWPGDLISESVNLADALDYLHNGLYTKSHVSLSHNDIKPDNILVVYPETTNKQDRFPVGQWKLADFGLSVVKRKRSSGTHSRHLSAYSAVVSPSHPQPTHRTKRSRSVSKAMPARDPGQYTAPEMDQTTPLPADCRRADVWSFGCVLSEIVTYAVRLDCQLVEDLRASVGTRFYDHESKDVKGQFLGHLDKLPGTACVDKRIPKTTHWISACVDLVKDIVIKEPHNRLEANKIRDRLSEIQLSMCGEVEEHPCPNLTLDLNKVDVDPVASGQVSAVSQSPTDYEDAESAREDARDQLPRFRFHSPSDTLAVFGHPPRNDESGRRRATTLG